MQQPSARSRGAQAGSDPRQATIAQCPATVMLHGPLRRSLTAAAGGYPVPATQRCILKGGHHGAHHALAGRHSAQHCWFRWDDSGFRVGRAGASAEPPSSHQRADARSPTPHRHALNQPGSAHWPGEPLRGPPPQHSLEQALSALTAALDRLTTVIELTDRRWSGPRSDI